jgi:hypothetical protein
MIDRGAVRLPFLMEEGEVAEITPLSFGHLPARGDASATYLYLSYEDGAFSTPSDALWAPAPL